MRSPHTTDTGTWHELETAPQTLRAIRIESLTRDCPFPTGYGRNREARAELPGAGSCVVQPGDWLVELIPGRVEVLPNAQFRALVGRDEYERAVAGLSPGEAEEFDRLAKKAAAEHVSNRPQPTFADAPCAICGDPQGAHGEGHPFAAYLDDTPGVVVRHPGIDASTPTDELPGVLLPFVPELEPRAGIEHAEGLSTLNDPR